MIQDASLMNRTRVDAFNILDPESCILYPGKPTNGQTG